MKNITLLICLLPFLGCSQKNDKDETLRKLLFDDQLITSSDWQKQNIDLQLFNAELKLGEIVKTSLAVGISKNRFGESIPINTKNQKFYFKSGKLISILTSDGILMKQHLQDKRRFDLFFIPNKIGGASQHIRISEFENDSSIKVLYYYKKNISISYSTDPIEEYGEVDFRDEDYILGAKQQIIINKFGKPKKIFWYHEDNLAAPVKQPFETFEYNKDGLLTERTLGEDSKFKYSYTNGFLTRESTITINSRDENGKPTDVITENIKYQYIPESSNWKKRIETDSSSYSSTSKPPQIAVIYFILEKKG